jgi:flagellar M-ring protein FliF
VRHVVQPSGGIKRIAAAIPVDDAVETGSEGDRKVETRHKRSAEEMKQIEELAKAAIGFDPARGDHLSVQNISFTGISPEGGPSNLPERLAPVLQEWMGVIRYVGLAALFFLIYFLIFRPVKRQIIAAFAVQQPQLPARAFEQGALGKAETLAHELKPKAGEGEGEDEGAPGELTGINAEVRRTVVLKNQLVERIKRNPEAASRLIQNWVRQSEAGA